MTMPTLSGPSSGGRSQPSDTNSRRTLPSVRTGREPTVSPRSAERDRAVTLYRNGGDRRSAISTSPVQRPGRGETPAPAAGRSQTETRSRDTQQARVTETRQQMDHLRQRIRASEGRSQGTQRPSGSGAVRAPAGNHAGNRSSGRGQGGYQDVQVDHAYHQRHAQKYRCNSGTGYKQTYCDRPSYGYHGSRSSYSYYDRRYRQCNRIIWPHYSCRVRYNCGRYPLVRTCYPY
ncbi:hypothetical protein ACFL6U_15875, partial [Planctomycetota bacterium]